jgi:hypothetical protein
MAVPDEKVYCNWMSFLRDDVLFNDIVWPESHNSGCVNCALRCCCACCCGIPLGWLNCQKHGIMTQLEYGTRAFDIRIAQTSALGVVCTHGFGRTTLTLETAMRELKQFRDQYPSEFFKIVIYPYFDKTPVDDELVRHIVEDTLDLPQFGFEASFKLGTRTVGEMRQSGKNFIIITCNSVAETFRCGGSVPQTGTWSADYHVGKVADGQRLFTHLNEVLSGDKANVSLAFNRASGDSICKQKPRDFAAADRPHFLWFIREVRANPEKLRKIAGCCFDWVTEDYEQTGCTILLNEAKGLIREDIVEEFVRRVQIRLGRMALDVGDFQPSAPVNP